MPSVADIIQITQCSRIMSQQACNVFYFTVAAWTGNLDIDEVLEYWRDEHWATMAGYYGTELQGEEITWRNLDNTAEVVTIENTVNGAQTGETLGPFVASSVRMLGETSETRSGWKRFAGLVEAHQANGVIATSPLAGIQTGAEALFADVTAATGTGPDSDAWLINVIVGRNVAGELDLSRVQPIASVVAQANLTTQNTRKVGRGS